LAGASRVVVLSEVHTLGQEGLAPVVQLGHDRRGAGGVELGQKALLQAPERPLALALALGVAGLAGLYL